MSNSEILQQSTQRTTRSTRSKRRQTQLEHDGSGTQSHRPKRRKNNPIKDDTFKARDSAEHVPEQSQALETDPTASTNGTIHPSAEASTHLDDANARAFSHHDDTALMTIRPKRTTRGDGATTLAQDRCHTVKLLPGTPKELRREGVEYRGRLGGTNHALAITRNQAIIWDYTAHTPETKEFDLPFACKAGDPLPFGALVSNGGSATELGLVLLSATGGKVVFYDSIERASSFGLFPDRQVGVEGVVGSLFSGESVVDLVSADHAGFVVVLSSGRIAHLILRDQQGRPKIASQFLRATGTNASFFGRLWAGGFKKDLCAVHLRPLHSRGEMQVVGMTEKAEALFWDIDWAGRAEFKSVVDFRELLSREVRAVELPEMQGRADMTTVVDFAIWDKPAESRGRELAVLGAEKPMKLILLARVGSVDRHCYAIVEISVVEDETAPIQFARLIQLSKYHATADFRRQQRPRLLIPAPGHTAYVVFEDATILVSIVERDDSGPAAQLETFTETFEQAINLRSGRELAFQGASAENAKAGHASVVAFVKSAGLVRVTAADVNALSQEPRTSAKSRIEQAVFYGALQQDNIIDFSRREHSDFPVEEIEKAAIQVSQEIFLSETSYTAFISQSPTTIDDSLAKKARALRALVDFARQNYPALSKSAMWQLLWDAERVAAAQRLWSAYEEHVANVIEQERKRRATLLDEMCDWFSEDQNSFAARAELRSEDPVRRFFIGGLHRLDKLLNYTSGLLADFKDNQEHTPERILRFVWQANDVWVRSLGAAFEFRSEHAAAYGLLPELFEEGVLIDSAEYIDLPEFWTSSESLVNNTVRVAAVSRYFAETFYNPEKMPEASESAADIAKSNPELVALYCLQAQEAIRWHASRPTAKERSKAQGLSEDFEQKRYKLCRALAGLGQSEAGINLAEKLRDMHTLSDMIIAEDQYFTEELSRDDDDENKAVVNRQQSELQSKVRKYFDRYGTDWANVFFGKLFSNGAAGSTLELAQQRWQKALGEYLRAHPSRAKLCWINDVTREVDFAHASKALAESAEEQEGRLWAKKVELSMSKLASLAAKEAGQVDGSDSSLSNRHVTAHASSGGELVLVNIQEHLHEQFEPLVYDCIDSGAKLQYCMEVLGTNTLDYPALRSLLESGLNLLLEHNALSIEQLLDVLTLSDMKDAATDGELQNGEKFFLALRALDAVAAGMPKQRLEMLTQLIWKRCYIYDDWATRAGSKHKSSDAERIAELRNTATWQTLYHALESGYLDEEEGAALTGRPRRRRVAFRLPSACLGSACHPHELSHRFPDQDLLDPILHDCKVQDELLQSYVADRSLDDVVRECTRDARRQIAAARRPLVEEEEEEEVGERTEEETHVHANGHSVVPLALHANGTGIVGATKARYVQEFAGEDEVLDGVETQNTEDLEDGEEEREEEDGETETGEEGEEEAETGEEEGEDEEAEDEEAEELEDADEMVTD